MKNTDMKLTYNLEDPFGSIIHKMVADDYPHMSSGGQMLVDILSETIFAGKSTRFGPRPSVESQVAIRSFLANAIEHGEPIRFVSPWGSEKPDGSGPDLAELSAFKQMTTLRERIERHYSPGAEFSVRVEDASAPYLFSERWKEAYTQAWEYSRRLEILASELDGKIHIYRESHEITPQKFAMEAESWAPTMQQWLQFPDDKHVQKDLEDQGWKTVLPPESIQFYYNQYEKMNPGMSLARKQEILARYFASVLVRKQQGLNGSRGWSQWMGISFAGPVPGSEGLFGKRVYYRTVPSSMTSLHMPPWRAKGYALVNGNDRTSVIKLASYNDLPKDLNSFCFGLSNLNGQANITADYVIAD